MLATRPDDPAALFARGTLARLTYRYADASRDYDRVRAISGAAVARYRAYSALGQAEILFTSARESDATLANDFALQLSRAARDREGEVLALVNLGVLRLRKTSPEAAGATFDSAARIIPRGDLDLAARVHCGHATVLARKAQEGAVTEARQGARLARRVGAGCPRRSPISCWFPRTRCIGSHSRRSSLAGIAWSSDTRCT